MSKRYNLKKKLSKFVNFKDFSEFPKKYCQSSHLIGPTTFKYSTYLNENVALTPGKREILKWPKIQNKAKTKSLYTKMFRKSPGIT